MRAKVWAGVAAVAAVAPQAEPCLGNPIQQRDEGCLHGAQAQGQAQVQEEEAQRPKMRAQDEQEA